MSIARPKNRWLRLTPDRFVIALLIVECLLWLSQRFRWFSFNEQKGWTVLIALAVIVAWLTMMLLWLVFSLVFRTRFQFSLRSLLMLILVCAIPCSWLAVEIEQARRQQEIVRKVTSPVGSYIAYDFQSDVEGYSVGELSVPAWLVRLLGVDFFSEIEVVQPGLGGFYWDAYDRSPTTKERLAELEEEIKLHEEGKPGKFPH